MRGAPRGGILEDVRKLFAMAAEKAGFSGEAVRVETERGQRIYKVFYDGALAGTYHALSGWFTDRSGRRYNMIELRAGWEGWAAGPDEETGQ